MRRFAAMLVGTLMITVGLTACSGSTEGRHVPVVIRHDHVANGGERLARRTEDVDRMPRRHAVT